ncbi:Guanine nucleotide-binding protein subunit alpha like protein [Lucilia cuprina]|nr:Guanine nucleotide-binding protein subunit alpha like protein [Lucilia cuprina]
MTSANSSIVHGEVLRAACSDSGTTTQLMEEHRSCLAATTEVINRGPSSRLQSSRFACLRCCGNLINYLIRLRNTPEELEQRYKSKEIDKFLEKEKQTFRRQARMQVLIDAREKLDIPWGNNDRDKDANETKLMECSTLEAEKFVQYAAIIRRLWQDRGIRRAYERRREFQISDSVNYFLDEIDRLAMNDYTPTHKDILHCRKATKGVYEFSVKIQNIPFVFVDVGGQRTQRQKWTRCFDTSVTSIIFLVSTSEFDQVLAEDRMTNRLEESRNIFDTIVNNNTFKGISIILFLNKMDLLEQKVKNPETDIRWFYPQFNGNPHSLLDVQNFILQMFMSVRKSQQSRTYHHFTTAIDTRNINVVFNSVKDTILQRNLNALMLQ